MTPQFMQSAYNGNRDVERCETCLEPLHQETPGISTESLVTGIDFCNCNTRTNVER